MSKVYVIIVTYNGTIWYERCFGSLRQSTIPIQTIVVDNASTDHTVEYITNNFPEITLFTSDKNLGFGQGNNKGMRYALDNGADYVFLINQDAWIEPDTIAELIRIQQENSHYGILSPINLFAAKDSILRGFIELIADYKNVDCRWIDDLYFNRLKDVYDIKSVNAAAWLLSRDILEIVGGFDPIFFHYGEDDNYLQRAHYHGFGVGICPKATIVHDAVVSSVLNEHMKIDGFKRTLLLKCTDINKLNMPILYLIFLIRKFFFSLVKIKIDSMKYYYNELQYLISVYHLIRLSRAQNTKKYPSWM